MMIDLGESQVLKWQMLQALKRGVDVVLLTTTPAFRPMHIKAAIDAGKHVFAEKPMAVDGPGLRSVIESAKKAKEKNLALVDGFVWRWTKANREADMTACMAGENAKKK